jgi:ATP-binding cassette subfamily F protein 3
MAPVAPFSGGEKARLVLALLICQRPNLLLLDEPTNHLDLEMRHTLSEALQEFEGALVVVSHDRHLLRVTSDELLLVDDGSVTNFSGDLDEYPAWLAQRQVGPDAVADVSAPLSGGSRKEKRRQEAEARSRLQPLRSRLQILDARLADLTTRHGELERELAAPELYLPTAKDRLLATLERKQRLDAELEQTESAWLEAGEELERQVARTT